MTKFAYFDSSRPSPQPVLGWYDTELFNYPRLPAPSNMLALTDAQWSVRVVGSWAVNGTQLIAYEHPVPPPTMAQQAAALQASGLAVTSTGDASLNATYPCDAAALNHILTEVFSIPLSDSDAGDGAETIPWLDVGGTRHEFSAAQFRALASATMAFAAGCARCVRGLSTTLPPAAAEIP
jgi:hypothetical protein